ncbi:trypsin-like peptidase domain-containing protein [Pseudorhodoferax sp.]|uniref:trypsin-like peptidase domain-containing protein n=1 Tax=Pseudorhodoferax sp. TaxID=1993553 RepID=UPI0039E65FD5
MPRRLSCALMAIALCLPALAQPADPADPARLFERLDPSVPVLEALDGQGEVIGTATAVAVGGGRFVAACTSIAGSDAIRLVAGGQSASAELKAHDARRNLCLLAAAGLGAVPAIEPAPGPGLPQVGARVFALSNALGLGVGLSEGVIAGVRRQGDMTLLQFTAPISPGSEGGALVDAQGRLVGIIDYRQRDRQNVNFALQAAAIAEIETRSVQDAHRQALLDRAPRLFRAADAEGLTQLAQDWTNRLPDDADGWAWLALAARLRNDAAAEEQAWRRAQQAEPSSFASLGIAGALLRQRRFAEAGTLAEGLLAQRQEDPAVWALLGLARHGAGELAQADEAYHKALSLDPWHGPAHEGLIALATGRGDHAAAAAAWARLVRLHPRQARLRWRLAESLLRSDQAARAWALLARLPADMADTGDGLFWQGATLVALGRPQQGADAFRASLAKAPSDPSRVWSELGKVYQNFHRFPEAIAAHRQAVQLAPHVPDRRFWLAVALKDGGHIEEALTIDRALVAELPNEAGGWRQLGMASAAAQQTEASIAALERSLALDSTQARLWGLLIEQYHAAGRHQDVRRAYASLRGLDPTMAERSYRATIAPYEQGAK